MLMIDHTNDTQKIHLFHLLDKVRNFRKDLGGYIEHYYHSEDLIIVKLTNGILKVNENLLEKQFSENEEPSEDEVKKLAESFVNAVLLKN